MQEFAEKLRIFKKTCEVVREKNAKTIAEGTKVRLLPSLALMNALPRFAEEVCLLHLQICFWALCSAHVA